MRTLLAVVLLTAFLLPGAATAATFVVYDTTDGSDTAPGDGTCETTDGTCTLRAAIEETNALPGHDRIELVSKTHRRIIAVELSISEDVDVVCATGTATIDAVGRARVLHVGPGVSVLLSHVVVRGGTTTGAPGGSGILNEGTVVVDDVSVLVNSGDAGTGIRNIGTLSGARLLVDHNGPGSAILNDGWLTLERSVVSRNDGIGLENHGSAGLTEVVIDHNLGGIVNEPGAAIVMERSALAFNGKRGAIENMGNALLRNSTVSGNEGAQASAVLVRDAGTLELAHVTIAENGGSDTPTAALDGDATATVRARSSIIAANHGNGSDPDCRLVVQSLGSNLMSCALTAPDPTTVTGNPRLAPLKEWRVLTLGGDDEVTLAHALLPGSAAIDTGSCDPGSVDQRGVARPQGAACDVGAFEVPPLCSGGVGITNARVTIRQSALGLSNIKVGGALAFEGPIPSVLDPLADGVQLRIDRTDSGGAPLLERTELTEPLIGIREGCDGWRAVRPGMRYGWRSSVSNGALCLPGHVGKLAVSLDDQRARAHGIVFKSKATLPRIEPGTLLRVTVVLSGDALGSDPAAPAPACAVQDLACTSNWSLRRFDCR